MSPRFDSVVTKESYQDSLLIENLWRICMGEVFCVTKGNEKELTHWVNAKPDRYVIWVGESSADHPRILKTDESELALQQIVAQLLYLPFVYEDSTHPALQRVARIQ